MLRCYFDRWSDDQKGPIIQWNLSLTGRNIRSSALWGSKAKAPTANRSRSRQARQNRNIEWNMVGRANHFCSAIFTWSIRRALNIRTCYSKWFGLWYSHNYFVWIVSFKLGVLNSRSALTLQPLHVLCFARSLENSWKTDQTWRTFRIFCIFSSISGAGEGVRGEKEVVLFIWKWRWGGSEEGRRGGAHRGWEGLWGAGRLNIFSGTKSHQAKVSSIGECLMLL